ncbi:MAG TPA: cytochrome c [Nitrospiraceae bacterium]|nr:cytochrome c [Nitrospiraceae bacterium]
MVGYSAYKLEAAMFYLRVVTGFIGLAMIASITYAGERVINKSRVPTGQLSTVKTLKNPLPNTPATLVKGKIIYEQKGRCILCHGVKGDGKGSAGVPPDPQPSPRSFRNLEWQKIRTDGELQWVISSGSHGSGMHSYDGILTDEEIWQVVLYIRSFGHQ